jgi:hypothetical protein
MKRTINVVLAFISLGGFLHAQERYLWLRLSDDRVVTNAVFQSFSGDSLNVSRGGRTLRVSLQEIEQVRILHESSIWKGTVIGAGVGVAVGGVVGIALRSADNPSPSPVTTTMVLGVLGAIIGSVSAAVESPGDVVDLVGNSVEDKREEIRKLILRNDDR